MHPNLTYPGQHDACALEWCIITGKIFLEVGLANTKSAKKRIRQNMKRRLRTRPIRTRARTFVRHAKGMVTEQSDPSGEAVRKAIRELDRAASRGVIHRNNAARRKSRLMKLMATAGKPETSGG